MLSPNCPGNLRPPPAETAAASLERYGAVFVVREMEEAFELANRIAPEHLELHLKEPFLWLGKIENAGAVFIGDHTPEPVGDYFAGPNHVLPTAGAARFASALGVDDFPEKNQRDRLFARRLRKGRPVDHPACRMKG